MTSTDAVPTDVIAGALRNLAQIVDSEDGVASAAIFQAAARMEEQAEEIERLRNERDALLASTPAHPAVRAGFEAWLGIKPCGAAHDLAWAAWKAGAAWQRTSDGGAA